MYRVYPSADASLAVVAEQVPDLDEAMVLFSGPHAQVLAKEFAEWKNSQARARKIATPTAKVPPKRPSNPVRRPSSDAARIPWRTTVPAGAARNV